MPPKPKKKSSKPMSKEPDLTTCHALLKDIGEMEVANMLGRMTLEEKIPSAFRGAEKGSFKDINFISIFLEKLPAAQAKEAIVILCKTLDQLSAPSVSEPYVPTQSSPTRQIAVQAITGLSRITESKIAYDRSAYYGILERSWPSIFRWIQSFYNEVITTLSSSSSAFVADPLFAMVTRSVHSIVSLIVDREEVLKRITSKDDSLLNLLVKIWLAPETLLFESSLVPNSPRYYCFNLLQENINMLDPSGVQLEMAVKNVLNEAHWDMGVATQRFLQHLRDPEKACGRGLMLVDLSMIIILRLTEERFHDDTISKLTDSLIKDGLLSITLQWLFFISKDLETPLELQTFSKDLTLHMIEICVRLCHNAITARNGPHWATRLLDLGFLSVVAHILSFVEHLPDDAKFYLWKMIAIDIPKYFCHRFVITAAIKAVKEITNTGDIKILETNEIRENWKAFTNSLMERTVLKTAFERMAPDCPSVRACANCKKTGSEVSLFKCASCMSIFYCSRECQTISWKSGGHRLGCKKAKVVMTVTGTGQPVDKFIHVVALAELRRHMPGLKRRLNSSGIQLKDAFFTITLTVPPSIRIQSIKDVIPDEQRAVHKGPLPAKYKVESCWGGRSNIVYTMNDFPQHILLFPPSNMYEENAKVEDAHLMCRSQALDEEEKKLAFVLDEVDRHVMDAREHFVPPAPGDNASPKTIYDYIEAKVAVDQKVLKWLQPRTRFGG